MPWDAGQAVGVASSLTLTNGRTVRSAVTVVSKGRGRAMDAQTRRRNRSPSMQAASGSGVTGRRAGQEQQRRPLATRAGPSGVQPVFVRPEENSDRLEGELFGLERDEDQGHPSAVDFGVVAGGPSPGQPDGEVGLVWILGHSYVYWGARRADVRPNGRQLGIPRQEAQVRWIGVPGMLWNRLRSEVHRFSCLDREPEVLVLYVGGGKTWEPGLCGILYGT